MSRRTTALRRPTMEKGVVRGSATGSWSKRFVLCGGVGGRGVFRRRGGIVGGGVVTTFLAATVAVNSLSKMAMFTTSTNASRGIRVTSTSSMSKAAVAF